MPRSRNSIDRAAVGVYRHSFVALFLAFCVVATLGCTDSRLGSQAATAITPASDGASPSATDSSDPFLGIDRSGAGDTTGGDATNGDAVVSDARPALCDGLAVRRAGTVANPELFEASGIVASRQYPGVFWAHNDSGSRPALFGIGREGEDLGSFPLPDTDGFDIEDIALLDGRVYLADIGDNNEVRDSVFVYAFDEPNPESAEGIGPVTTIELVYPDGPHDAEGFFVDPISGELAIVDKSFRFGGASTLLSPAPGRIFTAPLPDSSTPPGQPIELYQAGTVALDRLSLEASATGPEDALFTQLGLGGLATGASIRADGRAIALRTYATVWLFERTDDQSVAEALAGTPCEAPTLAEEQGEAVGFLADETSNPSQAAGFVTVSEGANPGLNLSEPQPR